MFQLLEQLRENRATLKAPQLQVLEQMEAQLSAMNLHQQQVHHLLSDVITEYHIRYVLGVWVFGLVLCSIRGREKCFALTYR